MQTNKFFLREFLSCLFQSRLGQVSFSCGRRYFIWRIVPLCARIAMRWVCTAIVSYLKAETIIHTTKSTKCVYMCAISFFVFVLFFIVIEIRFFMILYASCIRFLLLFIFLFAFMF